jgi:SPP1 family phage portal protein
MIRRNDRPFRDIVKNGEYGLKTAYTDYETVNADNVVEIVGKTIGIFYRNRERADYLWRYKNGDQPILYREKEVREEINNAVVENHAWEFVHFLNSQETGEPIQTISLSENESVGKYVDIFNDYCRGANKQLRDARCGEWTHATGTGYKAVQLKESDIPFRIVIPTPLNTYIVYNRSTEEPMLAVQMLEDTEGNSYKLCYSDTHEYRIQNSKLMTVVDHNGQEVIEKIHAFGGIPIVEYPNNQDRLSDIELVITMLDAINDIQANRADSIEQFVQSYMILRNCRIDEKTYQAMKEEGAIIVEDSGDGKQSEVKMLEQELSQSESQVAKNDLFDNILRILSIPSDQGNTGGDTQGAVELRNNWSKSKQNAKLRDAYIKESEKRLDAVILHVINQATNNSCPLGILDYDVQVNRNPTDNLQVRAQVLQLLLSCGVHPKLATERSGLWGDSEKAYLQSKPYYDVKYKTVDETAVFEKKNDEVKDDNPEQVNEDRQT